MGFVPQAFMLQPGQGKPCTQEIHALLLHFINFWFERKYHWKLIIRKKKKKSSNISGSEAPVCSNEAGPDLQLTEAIWYLCSH